MLLANRNHRMNSSTDQRLNNLLGWHLIGSYKPDDVGAWILHHEGHAMLLEVPRGLKVSDVEEALEVLGNPSLVFVTASHCHEDHLCLPVWQKLLYNFPKASMFFPDRVCGGPRCEKLLHLGGEPLWLIRAPKHSWSDIVVVFRGVACTGDIELGTVSSVNSEVPEGIRQRSMDWLQGFPQRNDYHVHTIVSAHLDDFRTGVNWGQLFSI